MNYSNLSIGELLISEDYITIPTPLAIALGLPRSVILKSIYAWCGSNRTQDKKEYFKAGYWWTKGTYELWQKQMPYIGCVGTVKRLILSLEKDGIIVSDFLHAKRSDREKWYRVDLKALEEFCNAKLVEFAETMRTKCDDDENTASNSVTKCADHENKIGRSNGTKCDDDLYLNKLSKRLDLNHLAREEEVRPQKTLSESEQDLTQDPIADQPASIPKDQKPSLLTALTIGDDQKRSAAAPIAAQQEIQVSPTAVMTVDLADITTRAQLIERQQRGILPDWKLRSPEGRAVIDSGFLKYVSSQMTNKGRMHPDLMANNHILKADIDPIVFAKVQGYWDVYVNANGTNDISHGLNAADRKMLERMNAINSLAPKYEGIAQ